MTTLKLVFLILLASTIFVLGSCASLEEKTNGIGILGSIESEQTPKHEGEFRVAKN